jgi:hypothetical protein
MPAAEHWPYSEVKQSYRKETKIVFTIRLWLSHHRSVTPKAVSCGSEKRVQTTQGFPQKPTVLS